MLAKVDLRAFGSRVGPMAPLRRKYPDRAVYYYEGTDSFTLYWPDEGGVILCTEVLRASFVSREEELNFRNDFMEKGVPLSEPYSESNPTIELVRSPTTEKIEKEPDLLDEIEDFISITPDTTGKITLS